jgi:hypothetical protein
MLLPAWENNSTDLVVLKKSHKFPFQPDKINEGPTSTLMKSLPSGDQAITLAN